MALTSMTAADTLQDFIGAVLFSIEDTPVFEALRLYREEPYADHGGHQPVTGVFEG